MAVMQRDWDIFCRVIDNFGDIGVCWRLARQLAGEHGLRVRLWVDDLHPLEAICPEIDPDLPVQTCQQVSVFRWQADFTVDAPGDVVIEAFACELPPVYISAMGKCTPSPVWINLEYLTAETWAEECHGMASPHPALPLKKYFFFPGFSPRSGGLLREQGLLARLDAQGGGQPREPLQISLFCYDTAPVGPWIDALITSPIRSRCYVPPGKPLAAVRSHLGGEGPWEIGSTCIEPIPFLALDAFDQLLARCDINFVRGEDSFVRAQWAGKPLVWQIYQQEEGAHLVKLAAFLDRCCPSGPWRRMNEAWNTGTNVAEAWRDFVDAYEPIRSQALRWRQQMADHPDLAAALVNFSRNRL